MNSCSSSLDTQLEIVLSAVLDDSANVIGILRLNESIRVTFDSAIIDFGSRCESFRQPNSVRMQRGTGLTVCPDENRRWLMILQVLPSSPWRRFPHQHE
jgi:hypothetical protein